MMPHRVESLQHGWALEYTVPARMGKQARIGTHCLSLGGGASR